MGRGQKYCWKLVYLFLTAFGNNDLIGGELKILLGFKGVG